MEAIVTFIGFCVYIFVVWFHIKYKNKKKDDRRISKRVNY